MTEEAAGAYAGAAGAAGSSGLSCGGRGAGAHAGTLHPPPPPRHPLMVAAACIQRAAARVLGMSHEALSEDSQVSTPNRNARKQSRH